MQAGGAPGAGPVFHGPEVTHGALALETRFAEGGRGGRKARRGETIGAIRDEAGGWAGQRRGQSGRAGRR